MTRTVLSLVLIFLFYASVSAEIINVPAGGDLQAALNRAAPGDEIVLQAGARYVGEFKLPTKPLGPTIKIRSSVGLPERRVTPSDSSLLPRISAGVNAPALVIENTTNWEIDGAQFESTPTGHGEIIQIRNASGITLDRVLIVAGPAGQKRGVLGNGRHITLTRSYIAGIWAAGQDSQAFCAWDGAGPFTITDNFLEAASENVMFGGADSSSEANVPADILVERNHFSKPMAWKGLSRVIKNLFELKSAKRVVIRHNLFENNWANEGQAGYAIVFTPRNQDGAAPWSVIEDVVFEHNVVQNTPAIFNILGFDDNHPSRQTKGIVIRHNLLIGNGEGRMALLSNEIDSVTFDHNTYISQPPALTSLIEMAAEGEIAQLNSPPRVPQFSVGTFIATNNLFQHNLYGVRTNTAAAGSATLVERTKLWTWSHNVLGGGSGNYPPITLMPSTEEYYAQFGPDYRLVSGSMFRGKAADGTDIGWHGSLPIIVLPTEPAPPTSTPFGGAFVDLPGIVQAENFDDGGSSIAFSDTTPVNEGGQYRQTAVDVESTTDVGGGFNVGWIRAGEWLNYSVLVPAAGNYTLEFRVSAETTGGAFHLEIKGQDKTGVLKIPSTGSWQTWTTITKTGVALSAGPQTWRVVFDSDTNGVVGNFNFIRVTEEKPLPPSTLTITLKSNTTATCRVVLTAKPPDSTSGWGVQFRRGNVNFGTKDASPPYERTSTVAIGNYLITAVWTKTGQQTRVSEPYALVCK